MRVPERLTKNPMALTFRVSFKRSYWEAVRKTEQAIHNPELPDNSSCSTPVMNPITFQNFPIHCSETSIGDLHPELETFREKIRLNQQFRFAAERMLTGMPLAPGLQAVLQKNREDFSEFLKGFFRAA